MYLDLCRTTFRFVRNVTFSISRPTRRSQVVPMPSKQASISSFFKPKTSNASNVQSTSKAAEKKSPKKLTKVKKSPPRKPDNKENVGKMIKNMELKSDSDSDDDVVQARTQKIILLNFSKKVRKLANF